MKTFVDWAIADCAAERPGSSHLRACETARAALFSSIFVSDLICCTSSGKESNGRNDPCQRHLQSTHVCRSSDLHIRRQSASRNLEVQVRARRAVRNWWRDSSDAPGYRNQVRSLTVRQRRYRAGKLPKQEVVSRIANRPSSSNIDRFAQYRFDGAPDIIHQSRSEVTAIAAKTIKIGRTKRRSRTFGITNRKGLVVSSLWTSFKAVRSGTASTAAPLNRPLGYWKRSGKRDAANQSLGLRKAYHPAVTTPKPLRFTERRIFKALPQPSSEAMASDAAIHVQNIRPNPHTWSPFI